MNVPTPGRGYWARLAAGEKLKRPPLPKASPQQAWVRLEQDPTAKPIETKDQPPEVVVPTTLEGAHPVVRKLATLLAKASLDQHQRLIVSGGSLAATVETHKRALLVLDGLCKAIETRGHAVELIPDGPKAFKLAANANGELVALSLSERLERTEHKQTEAEREQVQRGQLAGIRKYDYWPGGRLRVDILDTHLARSMWSDTDSRPLDRILGQVLIAIEAVAGEQTRKKVEEHQRQEAEAQRRAEEERRRHQRAEEQARAQAEAQQQQKLIEYKHLLARDVDRLAARWAQAKQVREFVEANDVALPEDKRDDVARRWFEAVQTYAVKLDPLSAADELALEIEPTGEALDEALANMRKLDERVRKERQ